jgi:hypothetical protein
VPRGAWYFAILSSFRFLQLAVAVPFYADREIKKRSRQQPGAFLFVLAVSLKRQVLCHRRGNDDADDGACLQSWPATFSKRR